MSTPYAAFAGSCGRTTSYATVMNMNAQSAPSDITSIEQSAGVNNCYSTQTVYFYGGGFYVSMSECARCMGDATRTSSSVSVPGGYAAAFGCDSISYYRCSCNVTCSSIDNWTSCSGNSAIQYKKTSTKDSVNCSCDNTYSYRCASGYYGNPTSCDSGCSPCPTHSASGIAGSCSAGSSSSSSCYIPSGTSWDFSDTKGEGTEKVASTCYYS